MENRKYYTVNHIDFARAILWASGEKYMTFDNKYDSNKKVYSFVNNEKVQLAIKYLNEIRDRIN